MRSRTRSTQAIRRLAQGAAVADPLDTDLVPTVA